LSGLISKEGAAQIIAAELGISFEDEDLKVSELIGGLRRVNIVGKVMNIFPVREFEKADRKGKVVNFILADDSGSTRVVLWDTNHIDLIENEEIKVGDVVEIRNGSTRDNEIHLSSFGELKKSDVKMDEVRSSPAGVEVGLSDVRQGMNVRSRGVVVSVFQPRFYSVCSTCNKKGIVEGEVFKCAEHGITERRDRAILNFVLDDGVESMRVVMFSDQINSLVPEEDLKDEAKATAFRDDFLGTEIYLSGRVNRNQLFNNLEIVASDVEKVDVEKLIEELSSNS
ncbi:MAG: OB-fold nucleic acid binding domain-containing protein, partial [Bacteroidales bacterium]|nr:OB-fold nucleic acid binding domain-containing protein [Bacteroidales bacterium]